VWTTKRETGATRRDERLNGENKTPMTKAGG